MKEYLIPIVVFIIIFAIVISVLVFNPRTSIYYQTDICTERYIPQIVHQTFATSNLPDEITSVINANKSLNPDYEFRFYDDAGCDKFIRDHFDDRVYRLYNKINPTYGAMKADFFRYCLMYEVGGVYLDIKSKIKTPLSEIITKDDICVLDIPKHTATERFFEGRFSYEQWLLIYAPKHPYLKEVIDYVCYNIENEFEPSFSFFSFNTPSKHKILNITGPDAYTNAINKYIDENFVLHRNIDFNAHFKLSGAKNYKKMYAVNDKKHYSASTEPFYIEHPKIIPKNIFMTWYSKDLPPKMKENLELVQLSNPEFNVYLYDDEDCRVLIEDYFDASVLEAYDTLIPGAYKADLWRLCALYIYGGVYMDMRYSIDSKQINSLLYDEHFVEDLIDSGNGIYNAFMVCKSGNKFLLDCISQILINIKDTYYGQSFLSPTGPMMMKKVMEDYGYKLNLDLKLQIKPHRIVSYNNVVKVNSYEEYDTEQKQMYAKKQQYHYSKLWSNRSIYKQEEIIPRNIFMTWSNKNLSKPMQNNVDLIRELNPEFNVYLYDDEECRKFISDYFENDVLIAFDTLIPGAYKADLWRLCVLYIYGGIYMDIKLQPINDFKFIHILDKERLCRDRPQYFSIWNGFMIMKAGNNFLKLGIDKIVENVQNKVYGKCPLDVTGPRMLGELYLENENSVGNTFSIDFTFESTNDMKFLGSKVMNNHYNGYYSKDRKQNYGDLWNKRKIYKI